MATANLGAWSTTAGNNATVGSINWAENQAASTVNDSARAMMADLRAWYNDAQWIEYGDGDGAYTATYVGASQFKFSGVNVTSVYHVGRRVKLIAPTPGTIYGTITVSAFSTDTTLTISWDSGSLSNETITNVYVGILSATNSSQPSQTSLAVSSTAAGIVGTITSTDAGASEGPDLDLYRDSASPANSDVLGGIQFNGRDSAANKQLYARIRAAITDVTSTSEDAKLVASTVVAGAETDILTLTAGAQIGTPTSGDMGAGTLNAAANAAATALQQNGKPAGLPLLQILTASTSASLLFTAANNTLYAGYLCVLKRVLPATNGVDLYLRASTDQGATLLSSSTYTHARGVGNSGATTGAAGSASDTKIIIAGVISNAGRGVNGHVLVMLGTAASDFQATFGLYHYDGTNFTTTFGGGEQSSSSVNGFGFIQSSGNITSGTIMVYGLPKV